MGKGHIDFAAHRSFRYAAHKALGTRSDLMAGPPKHFQR